MPSAAIVVAAVATLDAASFAATLNAARGAVARNVSVAPAPPPACAEDPGYFQQGEQWGVKTNWTTCTNWTGYTCANGGWGITKPDEIAYLVAACPVSCLDGPCNPATLGEKSYDDFSYDSSYGGWAQTECACDVEWQGDGECDRLCNTPACSYDLGDCFHSDTGCYNHPTGADYRGNVSRTKDGQRCQFWESQWPNYHEYTVANYPDANLGGHNSCRNPAPADGSSGPWCIVDSYEAVWGYCDVGPVSASACPTPRPWSQHNHTALPLGAWHDASVYEHRYDYYKVALPPGLRGFQVVVVPRTGDPNLYVSFDVPFPTGHNYTYKQDNAGVEVFYMTSGTYGYCGGPGSSGGGGGAPGGCTLYLAVTAYETSSYNLVVMDTGRPEGTSCAEGCAWKQLGDGRCQPACNNTACFDDCGD